MLVLTIRTDQPEAEIGLYQDDQQLAYTTWLAHKQLSNTIHHKIQDLLASQSKTLQDLTGIIAYEGPGSFTGLRIGLSVANALAYGLGLPAVGSTNEDWISHGLDRLKHVHKNRVVLPNYGAPPHITRPTH